ncbi:MAG: hypothetical protein RLZ16_272 [Bacteroidota bacterium]
MELRKITREILKKCQNKRRSTASPFKYIDNQVVTNRLPGTEMPGTDQNYPKPGNQGRPTPALKGQGIAKRINNKAIM